MCESPTEGQNQSNIHWSETWVLLMFIN